MRHIHSFFSLFSVIVLLSCGDTNGDNPPSQEELKAKAIEVLDPPQVSEVQKMELETNDTTSTVANDSINSSEITLP